MKAIKFLALGLLLAASTLSFSADAKTAAKFQSQKEWVKLGSRVVNMTADHDEILVTAKDGVFTKVRLKIMKAPIHLKNINIIFGNGENKNVKFDKKFPAGSVTRVIDLKGNKRIIKKVKLNFKSVPVGKGKAVVTLMGRR